jgi:4-hydroxy-2-oxoheptanedioate aldolase
MNLVSRLRAGEKLLSAWSLIPEPLIAELVAGLGFDAVTLDMQHGGHDGTSVMRSLGPVAAAGAHGLVRIPVGRNDLASKVLDFGADAVIAPMINTAADARAFAAAVKFPPVGSRSWGSFRPLFSPSAAPGQRYLETANEDTLALAMIETPAAVANCEAILATEGIDGVFVGPSDLSIGWTGGKTIDPVLEDMMPAIAGIAGNARRLGKAAAIFVSDPAMTGRYAGMGYGLLAISNEIRFLKAGARDFIDVARGSIG